MALVLKSTAHAPPAQRRQWSVRLPRISHLPASRNRVHHQRQHEHHAIYLKSRAAPPARFIQPLSALLSMRCSGDPRLFTASVAYSVLFPYALTVFASAAQRHRCHLFAAVWAIIRDFSCIDALPTPVFCKRHPHSTAGTLRRVLFIYSPLRHFPSPFQVWDSAPGSCGIYPQQTPQHTARQYKRG